MSGEPTKSSGRDCLARGLNRTSASCCGLSDAAGDWETNERLKRLCTIPKPEMLTGSWDRSAFALETRILRSLTWFGVLEYGRDALPGCQFEARHPYRKAPCSIANQVQY